MLFNAVVISVIVMVVLSLLRINVLFALILAALTAGLLSGMNLIEASTVMINGMGGQSQTALSYILLGIFAVMIGMSGITSVLVNKMLKLFTGKKVILVLSIAVIASFSQNLVPVHIAFIPILIPPLLMLFDKIKLDRRAVASALTFGLKFPYITIPVGYGLIFQGIIQEEMANNGIELSLGDITKAMLLPGTAMVIGLIIAVFFSYRKDREAKRVVDVNIQDIEMGEEAVKDQGDSFQFIHAFTILAILVALITQIYTDSLVLGALSGIIVMFIFRVVKFYEGDEVVNKGIGMMGMIAFVMLVASGYAEVLKETGAIDELVEGTVQAMGDSPFMISLLLLAVGLLITMGIGTSFGTIPILAALYVPIFLATGIAPVAGAALIGTAAALGDAGSPASDSTLGPTAGLNADGKHHHIWDTCVPTFIHFNIPLFVLGLFAIYIFT